MKTFLTVVLCIATIIQTYAQSVEQQVADFYAQGISLQEGCESCETKYRLYDAITDVFKCEPRQWRRYATACGEHLSNEYNRRALSNIDLLHDAPVRTDVTTQYQENLDAMQKDMMAMQSAYSTGTVSIPMVGVVDTVDSREMIQECWVQPLQVSVIKVVGEVESELMKAEPLPTSGALLWLEDMWYRWEDGREAAAYRASRYAIRMACKHGGLNGPVGYVSSRRGQVDFVNEYGLTVPWLGFDEEKYKKWYGVRDVGKSYTHVHKAVPMRKLFKARRITVAQSRAACKKK
jgi:hypothetical protein